MSCHCWQADINIPQPLHQGLMAVHQAAMRHTGPHRPGVDTHSVGTFIGIARSLMEMGKEKSGRTRSHMRQTRILCFSMFTWAKIHRFIHKIPPTHLKSAYKFTFKCTHTVCAYFFFLSQTEALPKKLSTAMCLAVLCSTLLKAKLFY